MNVGAARRVIVAIAGCSGALTLLVATVPALRFAYRSVTVHAVFETASSLVAVLAAFLVVGRLRRHACLNELLLTFALALLALSTLSFGLLAAFLGGGPRSVAAWSGQTCSTLGALTLAASSLAPRRRLHRARRDGAIGSAGVLLIVALTVVIVAVLREDLPSDVRITGPTSGSWPDLSAPAALLALHALSAVGFATASIGFLRRAERRGDEFFAWLAVASLLAAASRVNYLLFPSRFTAWVYTGDALRLLFYLVLLVASMREIGSYWRSMAEAAVLEERRRIARNLHDGVAQEIAYIARNLRSLPPRDAEDQERLERLQRATDRAERESRQALAALSVSADEPLEVVIARAAAAVAERFGADLELDLVSGVRVSPGRAESLVRIACEAVANAARHSGAHHIGLTLEHAQGGLRLRVRDAGCGFDPSEATDGFGLVSMRERARAAGGRLRVESAPGRGTTVEAAV
jgi:signal transduction histidine kinase